GALVQAVAGGLGVAGDQRVVGGADSAGDPRRADDVVQRPGVVVAVAGDDHLGRLELDLPVLHERLEVGDVGAEGVVGDELGGDRQTEDLRLDQLVDRRTGVGYFVQVPLVGEPQPVVGLLRLLRVHGRLHQARQVVHGRFGDDV